MNEIDLEKKRIIQESAKRLGSKIQSLRKAKGLSLMQLATELDVSDTALSKIETAKTVSITIELGKGIASALGISFNELFEIEPPINQNVDLAINENEKLKEKIKELEKMISLYEKQVDFLSPYFYAYKSTSDETQRIVLTVIALYEEYLKKSGISRLAPIGLISNDVRKEAIKMLKNQYAWIDEKRFEEEYKTLKEKIEQAKSE